MSRKIGIFIFLFLLVILQVSFLPHFFNEKNIPNMVLLVLIFFTVRRGFGEVWPSAIMAGLLLDLFSFFPVGFHIFSFAFSLLIVGMLTKRFLVANSVWKFFIFIFLVIIGVVANDIALLIFSRSANIFVKIAGVVAPPIGYDFWLKILGSLIVFAIIYWPMAKFEKMRGLYNQNLAMRNTK
jgi:rod shape-determining protein MreD